MRVDCIYALRVLACAAGLAGGMALADAALAGPAPATRAPADATRADTVIADVAVVDPTDGSVRHAQDVTLAAGRIVSVRPHRTAPGQGRRIDGRGAWLVPGLIDAHVHLEHFASPGVLWHFLARGITTVRQMDGRPGHLRWRARIDEGRMPGPRLVVGSPIVNGRFAAQPEHCVAADAADATALVAHFAAAGYDFVKTYHGLDPDVFTALAAAAAARGMPVAGHVPVRLDPAAALAAGLDVLEHVTSLDELVAPHDVPRRGWHWKQLGFALEADPRQFEAAARVLVGAQAWLVPTLGAADLRYLGDAHRARLQARPGIRALPEAMRAAWAPPGWGGQRARIHEALDAADLADLAAGERQARQLLRVLHREGVRLGLGTDTPNPYLPPGRSLLEEMQRYIDAGLPAAAVLGIATRGNADLLGRADHACVQPGCVADLVLLEADPRASPDAFEAPRGVIVGGRWHGAGELRRRVRDAATLAPAASPPRADAPAPWCTSAG